MRVDTPRRSYLVSKGLLDQAKSVRRLGRDHYGGCEEEDAEHGEMVAAQDRFEGEPAQARPVEHRLDQHRALQQFAELKAGEDALSGRARPRPTAAWDPTPFRADP